MKKKVLALFLAAAMTLSLAACGSSSSSSSSDSSSSDSTEETTEEETAEEETEEAEEETSEESTDTASASSDYDGCLNIGIPSDPADLSPFVTMSVGRMYTLETVYEYLGAYEEKNGDYVGWLAQTIDVSDDGLDITITLYDNINDSAGNHITTSDVVFCYETGIEAECSISTGYIDSMEVIDDYTMIFHMNSALIEGWEGALSAIPIVSQAAYEASDDGFSRYPITTSAYVVDSFVAGSSLHLTRRDDYWGDDYMEDLAIKSYPEEIEFDVILESSQLSIALETGAIEIAQGMSTTEIERFMEGGEEYGNYQVVSTPDTRIYTLLFNMDESSYFYSNLELRQAISYAIDAQGLVDGILNGGGTPAIAVGSAYSADYNEDWGVDNYTYDLDKAKELVESSGYDGRTFTLICQSGGYQSSTCELVQAYLLAIGITTEIEVVDSGLFDSVKYDPEEWDLMVDTIGGGTRVSAFAHQQDATGHSYYNASLLNDPEWQYLIEQCTYLDTLSDETLLAWVEYTNENCILYPMFTAESYVATSNNVSNVIFSNRSCVYPGDVIVE